MYVSPAVRWLLPAIVLLFLGGMALGKLSEREDPLPVGQAWDSGKRIEQDRAYLAKVLDAIGADQERPFQVEVNGGSLKGRFRGEHFLLEGDVNGRHLLLKRDETGLSAAVDGKVQEPLSAPFALYTPYEHVKLVKARLDEMTPLPVVDPQETRWIGYQLALPAGDVKELLATWLGPSFPTKDVFDKSFEDVSVGYQLWVDPATDRLVQLDVNMELDGRPSRKRDQLTFRLAEAQPLPE